jgi:hypothetical protein
VRKRAAGRVAAGFAYLRYYIMRDPSLEPLCLRLIRPKNKGIESWLVNDAERLPLSRPVDAVGLTDVVFIQSRHGVSRVSNV